MTSAVLVGNCGEVALRIQRAARNLGLRTVAVYAADDQFSGHVAEADAAVPLAGTGPAAYLDIGAIVDAATAAGCELVHPGYGFLSENPELARCCADRGLRFVGPSADALALLGDKVATRHLAERLAVPVLPASPVIEDAADALPGKGTSTVVASPASTAKAAPVAWTGLIVQRYVQRYGVPAAAAATLAVAARANAARHPGALMRDVPLTQADHQRSALVADPLRVLDCCRPTPPPCWSSRRPNGPAICAIRQ